MLEVGEIFSIQEDFVLLVVHTSIVFEPSFAFGNRHVQVLSTRCLYIEKIGAFSSSNWMREEFFSVWLVAHLTVSIAANILEVNGDAKDSLLELSQRIKSKCPEWVVGSNI